LDNLLQDVEQHNRKLLAPVGQLGQDGPAIKTAQPSSSPLRSLSPFSAINFPSPSTPSLVWDSTPPASPDSPQSPYQGYQSNALSYLYEQQALLPGSTDPFLKSVMAEDSDERKWSYQTREASSDTTSSSETSSTKVSDVSMSSSPQSFGTSDSSLYFDAFDGPLDLAAHFDKVLRPSTLAQRDVEPGTVSLDQIECKPIQLAEARAISPDSITQPTRYACNKRTGSPLFIDQCLVVKSSKSARLDTGSSTDRKRT
jgi:hypothetical protein